MQSNTAVIMSLYRGDKYAYVVEALESLYAQTHSADIFLQQDGPIDVQIEQMLDRALQEGKIAYLGKRAENRGLAYSLNELIEVVRARGYAYLVRMDADDIAIHSRIEKQVAFMEAHPRVDVVGGWIEEFNTSNGMKQVVVYQEEHHEILEELVKRNPMAHVTVCFRNRFFDTIPSYDTTKLNEDFDLWIRALKAGIHLHNIPEVLVNVRVSNDFYARRASLRRAVEVMQLKIDATRQFGFGLKGYIYALAHFGLFMAPAWLKRWAYHNLRGNHETTE